MKDIINIIEIVNIENKYKNKFKENTEEKFNIFKICGVNHYENTHSAILVELLKNDSSHNFKNKFLEAFLVTLKSEGILDKDFDFAFSNIKVIPEFHTEYGRIDILIKNDYQCIIIENKIYASDQFEQLKRYSSFGTEFYNDQFQLLYLTLWGNEATENSGGGINYKQISYQDTILKWLERCVEISARNPIIRETIIQYINHINHLTNNNFDIKMNEELIKILSKTENLDAVFSIGENLNNVKNKIINDSFLHQLTNVCKELNLINESTEYDRVNNSWSGFQFKNPNWKVFKIAFEFEAKGLRNSIIGINHIDPEIRNENTFEILKTRFKGKNQNWVWSDFQKYNSWGKEAMIAIQNGEMENAFKNEIEKILKLTEDLEM
jgi:hypothetical protein